MQVKKICFIVFILLYANSFAQKNTTTYIGTFSIGTRNTISIFNDDNATGLGIGGQVRLQLGKKLNSEWYLDYITSNTNFTTRNDYHIGWSLLFYTKNNYQFNTVLQPYFIAGHCFDLSKVFETNNKLNNESRLSMATQAGIGTHINITSTFDCSLSAQYMLHFGKEINTNIQGNTVIISKEDFSKPEGHLLFSISFNYKLHKLWNKN